MSTKITDFIVMSTRKPPMHDTGCWTTHENKEDAFDCAESVRGDVFKRVNKDGDITLKKIKRKEGS